MDYSKLPMEHLNNTNGKLAAFIPKTIKYKWETTKYQWKNMVLPMGFSVMPTGNPEKFTSKSRIK